MISVRVTIAELFRQCVGSDFLCFADFLESDVSVGIAGNIKALPLHEGNKLFFGVAE